jgi:hypothetical protein
MRSNGDREPENRRALEPRRIADSTVCEANRVMTDATARRVADVLLTAVALGVSIYIARTPALRRVVWRVAVTTLTGALPGWIGRELQKAWAESAHSRI